MDIDRKRLQCHCVVFSQLFSPCGTVLVTGDNFGRLGVFPLKELLVPSAPSSQEKVDSCVTFSVHKGSTIYSMQTIGDYLVCGSTCGISAFKWSTIVSAAYSLTDIAEDSLTQAWSLEPPSAIGGGYIVNGLCTLGEHLVSASASGSVLMWDIETRQVARKFEGHSKQVLCVAERPDSAEQCFSGSDDGTVKLWDSRTSSCCHTIMPGSSSSQDSSAGWISAVAIDSNDRWLACGGSNSLSMHHIAMLSSNQTKTSSPSDLAPIACPEVATHGASSSVGCTNACTFSDESLLSVGSSSQLYHWDFGARCQKEVPCSSKILYSVALQGAGRDQVISCAGTSCNVDVYTGYMYGALKLTLG